MTDKSPNSSTDKYSTFRSGRERVALGLVLLGGLAFSINAAWRIAQEQTKTHALRAILPVVAFLMAVTLVLFALYLG